MYATTKSLFEMDEVVVSASIRHKLKQRIKQSSFKKDKSVHSDDERLDHRVKQTLASNQSDHPSAEQCYQFFCSDEQNSQATAEDEDKNVTRVLTTRFKPEKGKYQEESRGDNTTTKRLSYNPIDDGIAVQPLLTTASSFYQKPLIWPMDSMNLKAGRNEKPLFKQISLRGLSTISDELFPNQLSVPLLTSSNLSDEVIDKMDPYDTETIRLKKMMDSFKERKDERPLEDTLSFCSLDEQLSHPRMRMLLMRSAGAPHLRNVAVPLNEREVPLSLLTTSEDYRRELGGNASGISGRKDRAIHIRDEIQEKLLLDSQSRGQRILTLQDLVHEEETTAIDFAYSFFTASDDQRPLRPTRKERKKRVTGAGESVNIIVTVLHASNLPLRLAVTEEPEMVDKRKQSLSVLEVEAVPEAVSSPVTPFVEAVFQRQTVRTVTADGSQATWNQSLDLALKSPNGDLSPATLSKIKDNIILNLFDEVVIFKRKGSMDDDSPPPAPLVERRWLGCLSIPFATLYVNSRIEGTFPVQTPITLMGYEFESVPASLRKSHLSNKSDAPDLSTIFLTLFLTIDPPLQKLQEVDLNCGTDEDESLVTYAQQFDAESIKRFPDRKFQSVVVSMGCKWVLAPRYLRPLRPPEVFHDTLVMEEVMRRLARYVSLIPSRAEFSSTGVVKDIWLTADQFLEIGMGDEEEHALLLCNFFLYLGRRAGVVIGTGIPEGLTSYVITYEYSPEETSVWNACTGQRYRISDPFVPLTNVSAVITADNVYANIQSQAHPNRVNFDLDKSSCWNPLFNKKTDKLFPNITLSSIQPEALQFAPVDQEEVKRLQEQLEKHIKSCLMRWRSKTPTFFNRSASQKLKKVLVRLERKTQSKNSHKSDERTDMQDVLSHYRVTGFPLQMSYTDMDSVTEALFATSVHVTDDPKVEFAVAVHLTAYPANVISLSVYVAALHLIAR